MKLQKIVRWLNQELALADFEDISLNGLQLGDLDADVAKVACAVDSGLAVFEQAVAQNAQMLFVHHGLFWGKPLAIQGGHYDRVKYLIDNHLALYAAHLPLDAHPTVGNNTGLAKALSLTDVKPFGAYGGQMIGCKGLLPKALSLSEVQKQLELSDQTSLRWEFGEGGVRSVAIISGDAPNEVRQAMVEEVDLYITGESSHALYHECQEARMSVLFAGHYQTETYGPRLMGQKIEQDLGLEVVFVDVPTYL